MIFSGLSSLMGCGVSKFDLDEVVSPSCEFKIVHERKNNHRAINAYRPLATKPSVEDGKKEDIIVEAANHGRKSVSLTPEDKMFVKETIQTNVQDRNAKRVGSGEKERGFGREKETRNEGLVAGGDSEEGEEDEDSEEEERGEDSILYPGSPSFREYCVYNTQNVKNADTGNGAKSEKQSQKEGFLNCDKGSRTQSAKSGRKGRGIRNVLNIGYIGGCGSSAVKK